MLALDLSKQAFAFLSELPPKQGRQIAEKLAALAADPTSLPSEVVKGYSPLRRVKAGEFRIVFAIEGETFKVRLTANRNDDEVYRLLKRGFGA